MTFNSHFRRRKRKHPPKQPKTLPRVGADGRQLDGTLTRSNGPTLTPVSHSPDPTKVNGNPKPGNKTNRTALIPKQISRDETYEIPKDGGTRYVSTSSKSKNNSLQRQQSADMPQYANPDSPNTPVFKTKSNESVTYMNYGSEASSSGGAYIVPPDQVPSGELKTAMFNNSDKEVAGSVGHSQTDRNQSVEIVDETAADRATYENDQPRIIPPKKSDSDNLGEFDNVYIHMDSAATPRSSQTCDEATLGTFDNVYMPMDPTDPLSASETTKKLNVQGQERPTAPEDLEREVREEIYMEPGTPVCDLPPPKPHNIAGVRYVNQPEVGLMFYS